MRNVFKLLASFLKFNLQMALAYRVDTIINILLNLTWLGWELLGLSIIFANTTNLSGWGPGELVALLGIFRLVNTLMSSLIWPATERFNTSVRDGSLDYTLLQPVNSLFMISFSRIVIWRSWDLILGVILVATGLTMSAQLITPLSVSYFIALTVGGTIILYSLWVVLIALTFWFTKFDNNVTILQALLDAGRYPASIYPLWLRAIITYLVPIAVATTVPLQALRGELSLMQVIMFLSIAVIALIVATRIWKAGVRQYSGASS